MIQDQKSFMVMGYSFLRADQITSISQEIMSTNWYSQWLPKRTLTIHADMNANLNRNWADMNDAVELSDLTPTKRVINFSLDVDKRVAPEILEKVIMAFREAFNMRMMAITHGAIAACYEPVAEFIEEGASFEARKHQPNLIEWESYPVKAVRRGRNN